MTCNCKSPCTCAESARYTGGGYLEPFPAGSHARDIPDLAKAKERIEDLEDELAAVKTTHMYGCDCSDDEACRWVRERDAARVEVERLQKAIIEWLTHLEQTGARYLDGVPGVLMDAVDPWVPTCTCHVPISCAKGCNHGF